MKHGIAILLAALLSSTVHAKDGKVVRKWPNGKIKSVGTMVDGKRQGMWKWYHENGKLDRAIPFVNGKKHGRAIQGTKQGNRWFETVFHSDVKHGEYKHYYYTKKNDREVLLSVTTGTYKKGKKHGTWVRQWTRAATARRDKREVLGVYKDGVRIDKRR